MVADFVVRKDFTFWFRALERVEVLFSSRVWLFAWSVLTSKDSFVAEGSHCEHCDYIVAKVGGLCI